MNKIIITGRLGRDTERKVANTGAEYVLFTVACNRTALKGKERVSDWFSCTAFNKVGAFIAQYFKKGDGIVLTGRMESNTSEAHGEKRTYWNLVVENAEFPVGGKRAEDVEPSEPTSIGKTAVDAIETNEDLPF